MSESKQRRYGQVPSTHGSVLTELISGEEKAGGTETGREAGESGRTKARTVPTPTPPARTPPRDKRTVYLSAEITPHYDEAVHELHARFVLPRGAVQDALVAVALRHRGEVEEILSGGT